MNTQSANPTAIGSRTKTGRQPAMRSTSLARRSVPRTRAERAATSITDARTRNAPGFNETGAENQSSPASRRRTPTAPATPGTPQEVAGNRNEPARIENSDHEQGAQQRRDDRENVSEYEGHRIVSGAGLVRR